MRALPCTLLALPLLGAALCEDGRIEIATPAGPIAAFHFGEEARVPYLWPVLGPGGVELTRAFPMEAGRAGEATDHPHHTSLWFAHGSVNGHDFWHGGDGARITTKPLAGTELLAGARVVRSEHRWAAPGGAELLAEAREMRFREVEGGRAIDFRIELTALEDIVFGDTKEGTFALRLNAELSLKGAAAKGRALNSEGATGADVWGKRARWIDYSGPVGSHELGVAVFDHPGNLRHPTWWHARDYGLVAANPFGVHDFESQPAGTGDHALPKGDALTLRYRVFMHSGLGDAAALDAAWRAWAELADGEQPESGR